MRLSIHGRLFEKGTLEVRQLPPGALVDTYHVSKTKTKCIICKRSQSEEKYWKEYSLCALNCYILYRFNMLKSMLHKCYASLIMIVISTLYETESQS